MADWLPDCSEGRGLGFIEFTSARDAEDAKYGMDRSILDGKEVQADSRLLSPLVALKAFYVS